MLILVADKRSRIRFALRLLIEQATGHTIVAEVPDAESLTTKIRETLPDLVLLEWELSKENNGRLLSSLKEDHPQMKVVILSGQPNCRKAALNAGADDRIGAHPGRFICQWMWRDVQCTRGLENILE